MAEERVDESFEGRFIEAFRFAFFMLFPKFGKILLPDKFVDPVMRASAHERRIASVHNKKDDSHSKHIGLQAVVFSIFHLGRPVAISANSGVQHIVVQFTLGISSQSEVGDLDIEI